MKTNLLLKTKKYMLILLLLNVLIIIISNIILSQDFIFRSTYSNLLTINYGALFINSLIYFNLQVYIKEKKPHYFLIALSTVIAIIIVIFSYCFISLSIQNELVVEKNNTPMIATVEYGLGQTSIKFYFPVNNFVMKKSDIPEEIYNDGSNPYTN